MSHVSKAVGDPSKLRSVLAALRKSDHAYIGLRPSDATFGGSPVILLAERGIHALGYALQTAGERWPDCAGWSLVGSDELLAHEDPLWPPTMRMLRDPETLAEF